MKIHWSFVGFMFVRYILITLGCIAIAIVLNAIVLEGKGAEFIFTFSTMEGFWIGAPMWMLYIFLPNRRFYAKK